MKHNYSYHLKVDYFLITEHPQVVVFFSLLYDNSFPILHFLLSIELYIVLFVLIVTFNVVENNLVHVIYAIAAIKSVLEDACLTFMEGVSGDSTL